MAAAQRCSFVSLIGLLAAGLTLLFRPPAHALHEVSSPCCSRPPPRSMSAWTRRQEAGISELLRRPLISTEVASALARWLRSSDVLPL
jgi:hypothetical protein